MSDTLTEGTVVIEGFAPKKLRKNATPRPNARKHIVGSSGDARAHVYSPSELPAGTTLTLSAADAEMKLLDHGEARFVWIDEDANILVKAFVPSADRGVESFVLTV